MKRILFPAALAVALATTFVAAQQPVPDQQPTAPIVRPHGEHHDPHRAAEMLSRRLNLTPDQTAKLEPVLAARQQKIAALQADTTLDSKARHQQMHAIQKDTRQQLSGILTPDQQQQMKSMRHGRERRNGEAPGPAV